MTRVCKNCGFENQDEYDFCAKCGTPLVEGLQPRRVYVYGAQLPPINKKALIAAYISTIFLSWSGFVVGIISKHSNFMAVFTFFGFFMPFYLVQARHPTLKKHGLIMMAISFVGVALSFYVMFN